MNNLFKYIVLILVAVSCQKTIAQHNNEVSSLYTAIELPYSSDSLKKFYHLDNMIGIELIPSNLTPLNFTESERVQQVKESEGFEKGKSYYPLISFYRNSILYKGIIYEGFADNDMNTFIFQLTSYDKNNNIIDAVLLDHRFVFEIYYWNDFIINEKGQITITKYSKQLYDFSEEEPNVNGDIKMEKVIYNLSEDGQFILKK